MRGKRGKKMNQSENSVLGLVKEEGGDFFRSLPLFLKNRGARCAAPLAD